MLPKIDIANASSEAGTTRHNEMADAIIGKEFHKLPDEVRELVAGLDVDAEVAMGFDVSTGRARVIGYNIGRAYGEPGPFEVVGSTDLIAVGNGRLVVLDWKGHQSVGAPAENAQLMFYALAASRIYNIDTVELVVAHIADSNNDIHRATVDALDLDAYAASLRVLYVRAAAATADDAVEGEHCKNCSSVESCPRKRSLALEVITGAADTRLEMLKPATPEAAAELYEFTSRLRMLLRRADAVLYAFAAETPIPLSNGKWLGKVESLGNRQIDGRKAFEIIKELHDEAVADEAVEMVATQSGIEAALKNALPKGGVKAAKDKIMARLEKVGGVIRKPRTTIEEFSRPLQLSSGAK